MNAIQMVRKPLGEWGPNEPPGTFDICDTAPSEGWSVADQSYKRIVYVCPRGNHCAVPFKPGELPNGASWNFDGNNDRPTVTPSINCVGGCGWHGFITEGVMR